MAWTTRMVEPATSTPFPIHGPKMLDILMFWAEKHIDGFRCDMAEMVPVEFWEWAIPQVKTKHPDLLFIAEVYNPKEYGNYLFRGKFDYLYDKVGLYDTLRAIVCGDESATAITRAWQSLGGIEKRMLISWKTKLLCKYRTGIWRAGHGQRGFSGKLTSVGRVKIGNCCSIRHSRFEHLLHGEVLNPR